jgi:hypothetical protein
MRLVVLSVILSALGCATPRVMVAHDYLGRDRTTKLVIQKTSADLFDTYVRVCTLLDTGEERDCVDTLVLSNVNPSSVY